MSTKRILSRGQQLVELSLNKNKRSEENAIVDSTHENTSMIEFLEVENMEINSITTNDLGLDNDLIFIDYGEEQIYEKETPIEDEILHPVIDFNMTSPIAELDNSETNSVDKNGQGLSQLNEVSSIESYDEFEAANILNSSGELYDPTEEVNSDTCVSEIQESVEANEKASDVSTRKMKRGKYAKQETWKWQTNAQLRMEGKAYEGIRKKSTGGYDNIPKKARCLKICKCRCQKVKMCSMFSSEERQDTLNKFWSLNWHQKKSFVAAAVDRTDVKQRTVNTMESRRHNTFMYHLIKDGNRYPVCKKMFMSTLDIGEKSLMNWLKLADKGMTAAAKQKLTPKRMAIKKERQSYQKAKEFLDTLPKLPSHYCRSSSSKFYLEPFFTSFSSLVRLYNLFCASNGIKPLSRPAFHTVFEELNLSLYKPKKDQCDICCSYSTDNIDEASYQAHVHRKEAARLSKSTDKARAIDNPSTRVITMDLQAVLLSPMLKASAMYYKTKLACHNFTINDLASKDTICYFWHEGEGDLTANSFASCLHNYIQDLPETVKTLIVYSDGCTYQNRNTILANTFLKCSFDHNIDIVQNILEKGHTQMEVDSVHSMIELSTRNKPIYSPFDYVRLIREARKENPYKVKYLDHSFFLDFSKAKYYNSIRPGVRAGDSVVTDLRVIKYTPDGNIQYKINYNDEFQDLPRRCKISSPASSDIIPRLHQSSLPIKSSKYNHLQELKCVLPKDVHAFYDQLIHDS